MVEIENNGYVKHNGRLKQFTVYLGKEFRSFIYLDDWKVLPMAALIAGLVAMIAASNMFKTMEGCITGSLAMTCICIWNGFFNSIQTVCRERDIVKREHRSGLHITAYISAHLVYQAFICLAQTVITLVVCSLLGMNFVAYGIVTGYLYIDLGITIFLTTYAADTMSLMISCIAKNTTAAMTVMPFLLIFELLFSDSLFTLPSEVKWMSDLSIAKWGLRCMASQANYNSLPMVSVWNQLVSFQNFEVDGIKPLYDIVAYIQENNLVNEFCMKVAENSQKAEYTTSLTNIYNCWLALILYAVNFTIVAILALSRIDKDKR